jgi:transcriptional regulator GlxA family with amidase domain
MSPQWSESEQIFGFFLTEGFSLPAYTSLSETFRIANEIAGTPLFRWYSVGRTRDLIRSASGLWTQPDMDIGTTERFHHLAVISSRNSHLYNDRTVMRGLRQLDRYGCALGGITSGTWLLARAGLLDGYRCTLHWRELQAFKETYPGLDVTESLYEIDRNRFSCSGGFAALDMILHIIVTQYGYELASQINHRLLNERFRAGGEPQLLHPHIPNAIVRQAILKMEQSLETPVSLKEIAKGCSISPRHLARLFDRYLGMTPQQQYVALRLDRAASLLRQTYMSMTEIAVATGFENLSHFSLAFKKRYLQSPSRFRKQLLDPGRLENAGNSV